VVLEVHDIDPATPGSQVAPAIVLYDGLLTEPPGFATYALINAGTMQCSVAFTRVSLAVDALVRSAARSRTRGRGVRERCWMERTAGFPRSLRFSFYPQYAPLANETIEVSYRGNGRALARVLDAASIAAHQFGGDDGCGGAYGKSACHHHARRRLRDGGSGAAG